MKWCFLVNSASFLPEFFGKLADQAIKKNDECIVILSSKIAEYSKKRFFPKEAIIISMMDWCFNNYNKEKNEFFGLSWKEFFPLFYRYNWGKIDYNKSIKITQQNIQFFQYIFEAEKPDIVISESPGGLFHEVAHYFCGKNNVPFLGTENSKFNGRIDIYDSNLFCSKYEETFNQLSDSDVSTEEKEYAQKFIKEFISHSTSKLIDDMHLDKIHFSQIGIVRHYLRRLGEISEVLLKYIFKRKAFKDFDCESETVLKVCLLAPFRTESRQFRIMFQKNVYSKIDRQDNNFFLYPLQFQPESSTSVSATYYYDQLNTIKNICFALPFPYKLYVKEHPASVGTRSKSFYKKIKEIPNAVLISPDENVQELIKKSQGVIVLTSTMGMEAALTGKPVYVFGKVYYLHYPLCRKVGNFEELKDKIKDDLVHKPDLKNMESVNNRFITSFFRNTIEGNILLASIGEDTNDYQQILEDLAEFNQR